MKWLVLSAVFACSSPASSPQSPAQQPPPSNTELPPPAPPPAAPAAKLGEPCATDDACGDRATCVHYYGIAGKSGPEFKSCEIKCAADPACPDGYGCVTIADGPGRVCRPHE